MNKILLCIGDIPAHAVFPARRVCTQLAPLSGVFSLSVQPNYRALCLPLRVFVEASNAAAHVQRLGTPRLPWAEFVYYDGRGRPYVVSPDMVFDAQRKQALHCCVQALAARHTFAYARQTTTDGHYGDGKLHVTRRHRLPSYHGLSSYSTFALLLRHVALQERHNPAAPMYVGWRRFTEPAGSMAPTAKMVWRVAKA